MINTLINQILQKFVLKAVSAPVQKRNLPKGNFPYWEKERFTF